MFTGEGKTRDRRRNLKIYLIFKKINSEGLYAKQKNFDFKKNVHGKPSTEK